MSAATFLYFLKSFADGVFQPCRQTSKYFSYFLFHIKAVMFHRVRKSMGSFFDFFSKSTCIFRRVVYIIEIKSGYSAAWFSAFVWGTKGREFESRYPDHFFCPEAQNSGFELFSFGQKKHEAVRLRFMQRRCASWHNVPLHTAQPCFIKA